MKHNWARWVVGVCLGVSLVMGVYLYLYPTHFSAKARLAQRMKVDPATYIEVTNLEEKAGNSVILSPQEMERVDKLANHSNRYIRDHAVGTLRFITGGKQRLDAIRIATSSLGDTGYEIRILALKALVRLHAPNTQEAIQRLLHDENRKVRSASAEIAQEVKGNGA